MDNSPKVSIIIPHYNNYNIIKDCLESIGNLTFENFETIVVDNASSDDSSQLLKNNHCDINFIQSEYNRGYAGGCNYGSEFAKGEYLLFLNNDTEHENNFIEPLVKFLDENDNVCSVQPKIKNYYEKNKFDYAGASGGFIDYLVFPFCRGRIFSSLEEDKNQYNNDIEVFWTSGTAFLTRKRIFNKLNRFDEQLFAHMEEIDYCWKGILSGYKNWVIPESVIYHKGGQTLSYDSPNKTYLNHRNSMILLLTNFNFFRSIYTFLFRVILEIISSIYDLLKLRPLHFLMHYKALIYLLFNINYIIKRRSFNSKIRTKNDTDILSQSFILNESIVKKYFLLNNKTYNKINL